MTPDRFCDWLQGYVELSGARPTDEQWASIKDHLALVYTKVTPERVKPTRAPRPTVLPETSYCAGLGGDNLLC
jgi:hypothetical protein